MTFWSVTYIDWPPLAGSPQRKIHATCDKVGDYCYIFRESSLSPFLQQDIDAIANTFDNHFVPELTAVYGPVPNALDKDTHVFILIFDESNWCGYWDPAKQMTDSMVFATWGRHSSEHEIIYIADNCFGGIESITAHEFGHMLHWLQDHSPEPPSNPVTYWEEAWIDEGFSTFADIYLTEGIFQQNVMDYQAFFLDEPDIPLIYFSNYNQVKLWTLFMFEHYGGWDYISALISNKLNGIAGMDSALRQINAPGTFQDAFVHWSLTNYLDDDVFQSGKYAYRHYNFNTCSLIASYNTYPTGTHNQTVNPYGTDYIRFTSSTPNPIALNFSGEADVLFRLAIIKMKQPGDSVISIEFITPDNDNNAIFYADSFGVEYNKLILVVCNVDSSLSEQETASYSYSSTSLSNISEINYPEQLTIYPNPSNETISIEAGDNIVMIKIYNLQGKNVYRATPDKSKFSIDVSAFPEANYLITVSTATNTVTKKIQFIR